MTEMGQVIDHQAELQQQLDQLSREIFLLAVAGVALAIAVTIMGIRLWHQ